MRTIPGFSNYKITRRGQVWSQPRKLCDGRNWGGRWLKWGKNKEGYLRVVLYKKGKRYYRTVHQLVLETYQGPCPKGLECRHLDGDPVNNWDWNLKWGTRSENQKDRVHHGTSCRGENHYLAKLTKLKVRRIRKLYLSGKYSQQKLAYQFNVVRTTIQQIIENRSWKHLEGGII